MSLMESCDLVHVAYDEVDPFWSLVEPWIDAAAEKSRGKMVGGDVYDMLLEGRMQLHLALDREKVRAVCVTEIIEYPRLKVCQILIVTGEGMESWWEMIVGIERWARAKGCQAMKSDTRPGWERFLKEKGYVKTHVVLEKDLRDA
jgi:hypothetical protein